MEYALQFECGGQPLVGVLHQPEMPLARGIVVVVGGGPQYHVGGHRQLVTWSRAFAANGYPVVRFDYRGMGDSYGEFRGFRHISDDIRAAIDQLTKANPQLKEVILWGECDAAPAILNYAPLDVRVKGAVLLNPFARTEAGQAKAIVRHYYVDRILQPTFWRKLLMLQFNPVESARSLVQLLSRAKAPSDPGAPSTSPSGTPSTAPLPEQLLTGFSILRGPVMLLMSGRDLVAREFDETVAKAPQWKKLVSSGKITRHDLPLADHTFSSSAWKAQVAALALTWLRSLPPLL